MPENKLGLRRTILLTVAVPLLLVLVGMICLAGWANISEDPTNRELPANFDFNLRTYDMEKFDNLFKSYQRFQANQNNVSDADKLATLVHFGDEFKQAGSPGQSLECYKSALLIGQRLEPSQKTRQTMADIDSSLAHSYVLMAKNENAYIVAVRSFKSLESMGVRNDKFVILNLATLLELSAEPKWIPDGDIYLNGLKHSTIAQAPPDVQATLYMRAAEFLQARRDIGNREIAWDRRQVPTSEIEQMYLHAALDAWKKLETGSIRSYAFYNEGVIYNRLGLLAAQAGDLANAQNCFQKALEDLKLNQTQGRRVATVLFNISDVELRQNKFWDYIQTHNQAKQLWSRSWS